MLHFKSNSRKINNSRISLDAKHGEMTKYFKDLHNELPSKKEQLLNLTAELDVLKKIQKCNYTNEQLDSFFNLKDVICKLTTEIYNIENNSEEYDYYLNTSSLLYKYYDNISNVANNISPTPPIKNTTKPPINIINFINKQNPTDNTKSNNIKSDNDNIKSDNDNIKSANDNIKSDNDNIKSDNDNIKSDNDNIKSDNDNIKSDNDNIKSDSNLDCDKLKSDKKINKIGDYIDETYSFKRSDLLDKYLQLVDKNYIPNIQFDNTIYYCQLCGIEKTIIQSEAIMVCKVCGLIDYIIIDSSKPSYRDPPLEVSYFAYKRINHFNEWISQFQAKESTEIPEHVYEALLSEIKKERITNMNQLTKTKVRYFLKKLKLNKYYEHIPHIINRLNGKSPPRISKEVEERLRIMFKEIQGPFMEVCPPNRKNFLSYSYVLHKFVELLGLDEYKKCFTLLKSREKLHIQDIMWRQITRKVGWEFYKSI
jgi:hypothetical protein